MNSELVRKIKNEYLTAEELAEILRLKSHKTILNWNYDGVFEHGKEVVRIRGVLLFYWPAIRERLHTLEQPRSRVRKAHGPRPDGCLINL